MPDASTLVLASSSTYRAAVLARAGFEIELRPPRFNESAHRADLATVDVEAYALSLAIGKLDSVKVSPGEVVIAADQVGVLGEGAAATELTQQPDAASALRQLMSMSGSTHRLVNAVAVRRLHPTSARPDTRHGFDVHEVTMRRYTEADARRYIEEFTPYDTAGSYRIEDDADLVACVDGSGDDGVMGMPVGLLDRLLSGWIAGSNT